MNTIPEARNVLLFAILIAATQTGHGAESLPDPTQPAVARSTAAVTSPEPVSYELSAIRVGAAGSLAVINGRLVRIGDRIGDADVTAIEADAVTLAVNHSAMRLPLLSVQVKKPVPRAEPMGGTH